MQAGMKVLFSLANFFINAFFFIHRVEVTWNKVNLTTKNLIFKDPRSLEKTEKQFHVKREKKKEKE